MVAGGTLAGVGMVLGVPAMSRESSTSGSTAPAPVPTRPSSRPVPVGPGSSFATRRAYDQAEAAYRRAAGRRSIPADPGGTLAWGVSRVLQSYLIMYDATHDRSYLDKLVDVSEAVLAARDDQTGRVDHRGRSLPAWGAAEPYTVSCADLDGTDGRPALRLASTAVGPAATVAVRQHELDLFDLVVTDPLGHSETVTGLSLDRGHSRYVVRVLARRYPATAGLTVADLRDSPLHPGLLRSRSRVSFMAQRYVFAVHTGMICAPLAQLAALLVREPDLAQRFAQPAGRLREAAEAAVSVHDADWRPVGTRRGLYAYGIGAPVRTDGTALPHNQYLAMARCQAQLFLATGDTSYRNRATLMLSLFQSDLGTSAAAPVWPYHWTGSPVYQGYEAGETTSVYSPRMPPVRNGEDPSHAGLDVDAVVAGFDTGLGVPRALLTRLTATFLTRVLRRGPDGGWSTAARFGSTTKLPPDDLAAARWLELARWDRRVAARVAALVDQAQPSGKDPQVLPILAQLVRLA